MAKIAILYECLGRSKGGIEAWVYHASEELLNQGHQITLIKAEADTPQDSAPQGVDIITLKTNKKIPVINFYFDIINRVNQLKSILPQYDLVWARSYIMAYAASKVLGKDKVIYINAAPYSLYGRVSFKDKLKNVKRLFNYLPAVVSEVLMKIAYVLEKKAIVGCKNVFLSKARMDETLTFFKINKAKLSFNVIAAGVNTNRFFPNKLPVSQECLKIISVGRLQKDKNIQCVLKAIKKLKDNGIPVELTIAGVGSYENQLINLTEELDIKDCVFFVGRQDNVEEWYRLNNVFVLPSLYEGFGSVYIEAMASGLPCIAISNKSGEYSVAADEIIDPNINGYLMTEDNPDELYFYLRKLYDNPELILELSRNAREKTINEFSWKNTVEKLLILN
nr:glycosyltransferase family 4 protein [uncultured Flavobacterium sp.]